MATLEDTWVIDSSSPSFLRNKKTGRTGTVPKGAKYYKVTFNRKPLYAHRVIMELLGFDLSSGVVDHIDGNKLNNNPDNLRLLSHRENLIAVIDKKSLGVTFDKERGKFLAQISISGKQKKLGRFSTFERAKKAYDDAVKVYYCNDDNTVTNGGMDGTI